MTELPSVVNSHGEAKSGLSEYSLTLVIILGSLETVLNTQVPLESC